MLLIIGMVMISSMGLVLMRLSYVVLGCVTSPYLPVVQHCHVREGQEAAEARGQRYLLCHVSGARARKRTTQLLQVIEMRISS